jgi:hypothetical protein
VLGCRDAELDCQGGLLGYWDGARSSGWNAIGCRGEVQDCRSGMLGCGMKCKIVGVEC